MAKNIITALDVGSSKICTIIASLSDDNERPQVIGVYNHPSTGVKKGVIVNIDEATNAIAESVAAAERMAGITVSSVYASIGGSHITSINSKGVVAVSSEEISEDDTFRAIENARTISIPPSREILHIIPREFIVDSQPGIKDPVGMTGTRLEVNTHIISATTTALQNLVKCVQQNGLGVEDVVFAGWASSHAVLTETEKDLGVTLLDIGGGTTSISIFQEGAISYSGCVPLGGLSITSDIAIGLQVSLEDAEKIKTHISKVIDSPEDSKKESEIKRTAIERKNVSKDKKKDEKKSKDDEIDISKLGIEGKKTISLTMYNQIVEARMEEVFEMVSDQVSQAGFDVAMPAGVVVTGGSAQLDEVSKIAQRAFGVPSRIGIPSGLVGMVEEVSGPEFATCQGLVKYAMSEGVEPGLQSKGFSPGKSSVGGIFDKITGWFKSLLP